MALERQRKIGHRSADEAVVAGAVEPGKRPRVPPRAASLPTQPGAAAPAQEAVRLPDEFVPFFGGDDGGPRVFGEEGEATAADDAELLDGPGGISPDHRPPTPTPPRGLRSPRFAGDAQLQACYDDHARLTVGARGASVAKVQSALADLGHDVGADVAKGTYGASTWNAVKAFKAAEKLGWEHMGDVGPGTMHRLDERFGPPPPSRASDFAEHERAADGGQPTAADFVHTGSLDLPVEQADPMVAMPAPPDEAAITAALMQRDDPAQLVGAGGGGHVSISDAIKNFTSGVNTSSPEATGNNVHEVGQFFWSRHVGETVSRQIEVLEGTPETHAFGAAARAAWREIMNVRRADAELARVFRLAMTNRTPARARMLALVEQTVDGGASIEQNLWASLNSRKDGSMPDLSRLRSLYTLRTLRLWDNLGCEVHVHKLAERMRVTGASAGKKAFDAPLGNAGFTDRRPIDMPASTREADVAAAVKPASEYHLGDVLAQSGVGAAATRMQALLDAGQVIHARLLSGVAVGDKRNDKPIPGAHRYAFSDAAGGDHSVLVIGYDGNAFVFADPDIGASNRPAPGFGLLFVDGNRLSTATSDAEMRVDKDGVQHNGQHRYQVIEVSTT